jgi:probable DNA metabolism protein
MIVYKIEDSVDGLLTAIFYSYEHRETPDIVTTGNYYQGAFLDDFKEILTDKEKADRVRKKLDTICGKDFLSMVEVGLKSCENLKATICFKYVTHAIKENRNISFDYALGVVMDFCDLKNRVGLEAHRFKGFLRFIETDSGVLYAHYSPDNDITGLIIHHFKKRFKYHPFIIHDVKRNIVATFDTKVVNIFKPEKPLNIYLSSAEEEYQKLWKNYFESVAIKERKNKRLQDGFLPNRYRKNMIEFFSKN